MTLRPHLLLGFALIGAAWCGVTPAEAQPAAAAEASQIFQEATEALSHGAFEQAISGLERLSDLGVKDASASYNRGLAYVQRGETLKRRPGDLGQAAAALREAEVQGYPGASTLLQRVRDQLNRTGVQRNKQPVSAEAPLSWSVVWLLPENVWAGFAALGSLTASLGVWLRRGQKQSPRHLAGNILGATGLGFLALFGSLTFAAKQLRQTTREAVVVVAEAVLLDESGSPLAARRVVGGSTGTEESASSVPEGASVFTLGNHKDPAPTNRGIVKIRWGSVEAWVKSTQLRSL
jgi:hypothetical protein